MKLINFKRKISISLLLIILIPLFLNLVWFRSGNIMGVAEAGVPFYNFQIQYEINKDAWAHYGLGYSSNISTASIPTNLFLAFLQNKGVPGFLLQACFFWATMVISGISIYFISKTLFPNLNSRFLILAVFFYWFNPFSMVNVWNRFLNNFFFIYMLLPISFLFFVKGLKDKKYYYAILIGLVSTTFSYALTSVAFNILLWLVLSYTAAFYIFVLKKAKDRLFVVKFFVVSLLFWCLTNLWWISQTVSYVYSGSFSAVEQTSFSLASNQQIFTNLSQRLGNLIYLLRFQHASFFSATSNIQWVDLYISPPIAYLSFAFLSIIFLPLVVIRKSFPILLMSGLIIVGIFLSKGNNPPFGELLDPIFGRVGFLQAFRNAFEKFGFILPLAGAPLFGYGIYVLVERMQKWQKLIYLFTFFWLVVIWGLPFWTGLVFTNNELPANMPQVGYQVRVPEYYKQASDWLSDKRGNFRLLVFPIGGEGITYNWEKGYTGVELSNQLLPVTSISLQTNVPFYENISGDLEKAFMTKGDFTKVANVLNAKYIMSRNDINWHIRTMRDPQDITEQLKRDSYQFKQVASFGTLTFWENLKWRDKKIYTSDNAILVSPQAGLPDARLLTDDSVLLGDNISLDKKLVSKYILHPLARFSLGSNSSLLPKTGQDIFPHTKYSPGSRIYKLMLFKEHFELNTTPNLVSKIKLGVQLLGKRLVEAKSEADLNNDKNVIIAIDEYESLLMTLSTFFPEYSFLKSDFDKELTNQEDFYSIFNEHKRRLSDLINHFSDKRQVVEKIEHTRKLLDSTLVNAKVQPVFGFKEEQAFPIQNRVVYKFDVKDGGEYELLWGDNSLSKYYQGNESVTLLQMDNKIIPLKTGLNESGARSFGKIYLSPGVHEVSRNTPDEVDLVEAPQEMDLEVKHGITKQTFPIKNYDPFASYTISFDYFIKTGSGVEVSVEANNARVDLGKTDPDYLKFLWPDNYDFGEKHFSGLVKLSASANAASLILKVYPWNDCETIYFTRGKDRCKNENFRYPYDRTTKVTVKNVSVTRNLVDEPILIKSSSLSPSPQSRIEYTKVDNTKYLVKVTDAKSPYILVLSDLFDPGWKVITASGNDVANKHFLVNAYANGWEINKLGNYELIVKFAPQDLLNPTLKISLLTFILGASCLIWRIIRR